MSKTCRFAVVLLVVVGAGCSSSDSKPPLKTCGTDTKVAFQGVSKSKSGTRVPGDACADSAECAPVRCACSSAGKSWQATACICGKCATPDAACQVTATPKLCE